MSARKRPKGEGGKSLERGPGGREEHLVLKDDLDFEDEDEDEFEEDEDVAVDEEDSDADGVAEDGASGGRLQDTDGNEEGGATQVWRPEVDSLEPGEELDFDPSAYDVLHSFHADWPCLSFAIAPNEMGAGRSTPPFTALLVTGTQADATNQNKLICMKVSKLGCMRHEDGEEDDMDEDDDDKSDDEEEPVMEHRSIKHPGVVNRICLMPQRPSVCATWSDNGSVHIWELSAVYESLGLDQASATAGPDKVRVVNPLFTYSKHTQEGYAIDFSNAATGKLATGDNDGKIRAWSIDASGACSVDAEPYVGHTSSVEDVRWSPVETSVFASCSADRTVAIWDMRKRSGPAISVRAHDADANVLSWNASVSYLMVSGADDGCFKIWDLRNLKSELPVAAFEWHKKPITSVECEDNQLTLWDMALEDDPEAQTISAGRDDLRDVPPQLYFVHQGQVDVKELHWHPQIPGMILSTAGDGFHMFRPAN